MYIVYAISYKWLILCYGLTIWTWSLNTATNVCYFQILNLVDIMHLYSLSQFVMNSTNVINILIECLLQYL